MSSDVVLTSALRSNLLSLQNTQNLIDKTQLRLATGLKVNSALDNPQNFFAAQSLDNRASDLTRLLDGIGQAISTIQAADQGIQALTKLIEQADSLATAALEATSSAAQSTSIEGDVDVSEYEVSAGLDGNITFSFTDQDGVLIELDGAATEVDVDITAGDTIDTIINNINAIRTDDGDKIVVASLTDSGRLKISTLDGANARLSIDTDDDTTATAQTLAGELGFSGVFSVVQGDTTNSAASDFIAVNIEASATVRSQALYDTNDTDEVANRSTLLTDLVRDINGDGTIGDAVFTINDDTNDVFTFNIGINGGAQVGIVVDENSTIQSLIDDINDNVSLNSRVQASFDDDTGRIIFSSLDGGVQSLDFSVSATESIAGAASNAVVTANFGFGTATAALTSGTVTVDTDTVESSHESVRFGEGGGDIAQAQRDFNKVRDQIDALVRDAGYRGVNLLNGDNLITTFNEDRSNQLTTEGDIFTSAGLGIDSAAFSTRAEIESSLDQARAALLKVRNFGGSIANDLAIIQTREDFTKNQINNLEEGRDKLTVADQNEEGANLLALQTRQTLGVTSLSLASQSQQSVLRLF